MSLSILRKWLNRGPARKGAARKKTPFRKCFLEVLEDRTLLSTFTVTATTDSSAAGAVGELRWAVNQANLNPGSIINFSLPANSTITLQHGELELFQNAQIQGSGNVTVSGNNQQRVLETAASTTVNISQLTITNGDGSPTNVIPFGNTGNQGGDIYNGGTLTLSGVTVENGFVIGISGAGGPTGRGGGIFNSPGSVLTLDGSTVQNNSATGAAGVGAAGIGEGGGIYNDANATQFGSVILTNGSQVINNQAVGGTASSFTGQTAGNGGKAKTGSAGGGGANGGFGGAAEGGGLFNNGGTLTIDATNSQNISISHNTATGANGGGGGNGGAGGTGTSGPGGVGGKGGNAGSGGNALGGGIYNASGTVTIKTDGKAGASEVLFDTDVVQGGNGGTTGTAGTGGTGGSKGNGGKGGAAGAAGNGGVATGGAIANPGGTLGAILQTTFSNDAANGGTATLVGGTGGTGGKAGSASKTGGAGGSAVTGGLGGNAVGGAVASLTGALTISASQFTTDTATGGAGGQGGQGGNGGTGGSKGNGGSAKKGGDGGVGGSATGGGLYNTAGVFSIDGSTFTTNAANSGVGGVGGTGGTGGNHGANGGVAGHGGNGGKGVNAGNAEGGAAFNSGGNLTVGATTGSTFTSNQANVNAGSAGGEGGLGGNGGSPASNGSAGDSNGLFTFNGGAFGYGGAIAVTTSNLSVSSSTFGGNQLIGGAGGDDSGHARLGGEGGTGATVYGGAISARQNVLNMTLNDDTFTSNSATAGAGGNSGREFVSGGWGGEAWGGAVSYNIPAGSGDITTNQINIVSSTFGNNQAIAGNGGQGVGSFTRGGNGGPESGGGAVAISDDPSVGPLATVVKYDPLVGPASTILNNTVTGGMGGNGFFGATSISANASGGNGTNVHGGGLYTLNSSLVVTDTTVDTNGATGGDGGTGGPGLGDGSVGGNGGNADGGGISFNNTTAKVASLPFSYTDDSNSVGYSVSGNTLTGGTGGVGGAAGGNSALGHGNSYIVGGSGGKGGNATGGGIYLMGGSTSTNLSTITNAEIDNNTLQAGDGGPAGNGSSSKGSKAPGTFAAGGNGGLAEGGAVFSTHPGATDTLTIIGSTMAGNTLTGGNGSNGGSGTTNNGGPGGNGGQGGSAEGGALWEGNSTLTASNSTFGGSNSSNSLTGGRGGAGNNAGLPAGVSGNDGGNGGAGGNAQGGAAFINSGTATFTNDTVVGNQAMNVGQGGAGGKLAGTGISGKSGTAKFGAATGTGGGIYVNSGIVQVGNSIIDTNTAATAAKDDVNGIFTSKGYNIFGTNPAGIIGTDQTNVSAAFLNLGPLLNNGGPTMTEALLSGSVALDAGNPTTNSPSYDQRGPDFVRIANSTVDVGAFEFQAPTITTPDPNGLNPNTAVAGGPAFLLTITGTAFETGATVYFGGDTLTPLTITSTTITVTVPATDIATAGTALVMVDNPDGSGSVGTVDSNAETFTITPQPALTLTYTDGNQNSDEGAIISGATVVTVTSSIPSGNNFSVTGLPAGLTFSNAVTNDHLVISGTIGARAAGSYNVTVNDTNGSQSASTTFTWTVNDTTPPTFTNPGNQNNTVGNKVNLATNPVDADAGSIAATNLPDGVSIDSTTGVISGTLAADAAGTYDVAITGSDGGVPNAPPVTFIWTVSNLALTNPGPQTNIVGDTVNLSIQADNPDAGSFTATNLPTGLNIDPDSGVIFGTIAANAAGNYATSVSDTQNLGATINTVSFSWTVTIGQTLQNPGNQNSTVGTAITALQIQDTKGDAGSFTATNLPPGLSISTNGQITGTPTTTTGSPFSVTVNDKENGTPASVTFTWTVTATSSTTLQNPGSQTNADGDTVNLVIQAKDADANSFKVTNLPPGLNIDASTGVISGTISAAADSGSPYSATVSDTEGGTPETVAFTWTVTVARPTFTNPGNQTNVVSDTVSSLATNPVNADAGTITAANLPTGLSINGITGVISGTIAANAAGTYAVTVSATDKGVPGSVSFTWTVSAPGAPTLTNPGNQSSIVGDTVSLTIPATGFDIGTFSFTNLPQGLTINGNTGVISGTIAASAAGTYAVTVSASHMGVSGTVAFTWTVSNPSSPTFTNPGKQSSSVGDPVNLTIPVTNADPGTIKATKLPTGLSIDPNTGVISGTITAAGTFNTTISATDRGVPGSVSFTWVVNASSGGGGGGGGGGGNGGVGGATTVSTPIIQNTYPLFLFQVETMTVNVTGPNGAPVNEGFVIFTVDGLAVTAPVVNGTATVTIVNPFLDFAILPELFFPHGLDAVYSDPNGIFGTSSASVLEQAILWDFFLSLFSNPSLFLMLGAG